MSPLLVSVLGHPPTVLAAASIALLAMYVGLELAGRVYHAVDRLGADLWVVAGAVAMGCGIWSTHFVGMSGARYPFYAGYQIALTTTSWAIALATAAVVMIAASRECLGRRALVAYSVVAGSGAAAMHYVGSEALIVVPEAAYDLRLVAAAIGIMTAGTALTLHLFARLRDVEGWLRVRRQIAAASVYASALVAMHYLAMGSTHFGPGTICLSSSGLDVDEMGGIVGFAAFTFLGLVLLMTALERRATSRARQLDGSLDLVREELRVVTFNDPVTGLPNRLVFQDRLKQAVARCDRTGDALAVLFVDLDGFRAVDHSWSDTHGDDVLRHVSARLVEEARVSDTVANVGGDQFLILMDGIKGAQAPVLVADRIVAVLKESAVMPDSALQVTASIGIALYPADGRMSTLVSHAVVAARNAKRSGGDGYCFFESTMNAEAQARDAWLHDLRRAVERNELELHYQPKMHARSGKIAGVEALLRWHHPTRGMVGPDIFIPLAEEFGLIGALGGWVVTEACRQMREWSDQGIRMRTAINISVHQLRKPGLADEIMAALHRHAVDPALLTCEITESGAMDDVAMTRTVFERLRALGIELSIDDFGTGHSSLSYLRQLPVRQLKIDRSFVGDLADSEDARVIVEAIIDLAHALRLEVVAEGVETIAQKNVLLELGCDKFQGYLFARPMPAAALTDMARDKTSRGETFRESLFATG